MSLYRPKDSPYWYISLYHNGQRIRRPTGTTTKTEAKRYHDKLVADLWTESKLGVPTGYVWTDAVKEWLKAAQRGQEDRYRLRWITAHIGVPLGVPDPPLNQIDKAVIASLIRAKRDEGAKPGTLKRYVSLTRAVLNDAKDAGWLATVPPMPPSKKIPGRVRWLSLEEWRRLEPLLPPHLRQLARFTLATGPRRHNATHLRWDQIDLGRRTLWWSAEDMKQGEALGIPLNDEALQILDEQRGLHAEWVFPYRGKPVYLTSTKAWHKALTGAGIEDFTWQGLRHTWASWHVMNGTRLEELQKLGGWKTLEMVQRYAHLGAQHLARVAGNVRPVSKL